MHSLSNEQTHYPVEEEFSDIPWNSLAHLPRNRTVRLAYPCQRDARALTGAIGALMDPELSEPQTTDLADGRPARNRHERPAR
jgi:hypothetical protein